MYDPQGTVHGGYSAALLDAACSCAVHSSLSADQGHTTVELKVACHRPITVEPGPVRAEAKVISVCKRIAFTETRLTDASGCVYASATSTLLVFQRTPPRFDSVHADLRRTRRTDAFVRRIYVLYLRG